MATGSLNNFSCSAVLVGIILPCMYFNASEKLTFLPAEPFFRVCSVLGTNWRVLNSAIFLPLLSWHLVSSLHSLEMGTHSLTNSITAYALMLYNSKCSELVIVDFPSILMPYKRVNFIS